ncbi:hypothetical protein ACIQI8_43175 [Streptomyces sp. NPDC092369]|uniref:hypothetical protein n=1 Tax=Streptomyces sp. NPDC092369 TaxID=3366015 RepID=UPI0037FB75D7
MLHKASAFTVDEVSGFHDAGDERFIDMLEMSWITGSEGAATARPCAAADRYQARALQP